MMPFRLLKRISKLRITIISLLLMLMYVILITTATPEQFSYFQHPYLITAFYMGYLLIIFPFDFTNQYYVSRFKSYDHLKIYTIIQLSVVAIVYTCVTFLLYFCIGAVLKDDFSLSKVIIYLICTVLSCVILNIYLVFLVIKKGSVFSKIIIFCFVCIGFGLNYFAGYFFSKVNFILFNMNTIFTYDFIVFSAITYLVLVGVCYLLSFMKEKEL